MKTGAGLKAATEKALKEPKFLLFLKLEHDMSINYFLHQHLVVGCTCGGCHIFYQLETDFLSRLVSTLSFCSFLVLVVIVIFR